MNRKEVYKVEIESYAINKEKKWGEVSIYNKSKCFIKSVFDNVTKLTLAGFLLEVGQHLSKGYIIAIALFLFLLFLLNVALDTARLVDKISSYALGREMGNAFNMVICFITMLLLGLFIHYIAIPIIADVIGYVSQKANM